MRRLQKIALLVVAANLAVIFLFPPFDMHTFGNALAPIFAGFHPIFTRTPNETINSDLLLLETRPSEETARLLQALQKRS